MKNNILLLFLILAAAFTPIFAKLGVEEISPISLGFFRFAIAAVLFYITLKVRKVKLKFEREDYYKLALLGIMSITLNQFFFLTGVKMSFASHSGIIYSLNPVFAYLTSVIRKTERFYYSKMLAILLTIVGIFFVFYESFIQTSANMNVLGGDILLVMAVLTFSTYVSFGKEFIAKYGALRAITAVFISGVIFYIPLFIYDIPNLTLENLTYKGIISFFYLSIVVAYLAYFTWYQVLKTTAVSKITTLSNLSPLITVIFSVIFLSESISIYLALGGIITILGVFIMHRISLELP